MSRKRMKVWLVFSVTAILLFTAGCGSEAPIEESSADMGSTVQSATDIQEDRTEESEVKAQGTTKIILTFGDTEVTAVLDNSKTTQEFLSRLPLTLSMNRYANREYYAAIPELPEDGEAISDFRNGDITYYTTGKSLAIFFGEEDSSSQSGLIRMGRITSDLDAFESLNEQEEVTITIAGGDEKMEYDFSEFSNVELIGIDIDTLDQDELSILCQQARYCQAMTEADTDTMRELVSEDTTFTHMSGRQQTREEYFADIENGSLRYFTIGIENPSVKVEGDYASITYTSVLNANAYGARGTYRMSGTHWYENRNGSWVQINTPENKED